MTDPAQPVPLLPLAYASEPPRFYSGLRRLRRGLILLAISRFLVFLLIAFELLARAAHARWGFRAGQLIWMYYTALGLVFLVGGCMVLGVSGSGRRGFSGGRLAVVLVLTVCMILRRLTDFQALFWMYSRYRRLTALRFLPHGNLAGLAYDAGWVVAGILILFHAWQTLRRVSGGRWLQPLGWTFAVTGAVWVTGLLLSVSFVFGHWQSASLHYGTVVISEQLMNALSLGLAVTEGMFALAAGVLLFLAIRSLRRTAVPAAPT